MTCPSRLVFDRDAAAHVAYGVVGIGWLVWVPVGDGGDGGDAWVDQVEAVEEAFDLGFGPHFHRDALGSVGGHPFGHGGPRFCVWYYRQGQHAAWGQWLQQPAYHPVCFLFIGDEL